MSIKGMSMTDIKNSIFSKLITNGNLIKALVIPEDDFLSATPTDSQLLLINNPISLIRTQIFPYTKLKFSPDDNGIYIMTRFYNFKKISYSYQKGTIDFYAIIPNDLEYTVEGSRYDYIVDRIDDALSDIGIGKFEFYNRSDVTIDDEHMGAMITFNVTDFKLDG